MAEPAESASIRWSPEALERLERAPLFLRGMVKRLAERRAREQGLTEVSADLLNQYKHEVMAPARAAYAQGQLPWTKAAQERLETIPEFMRGIIKQIAEEVASERGHLEVNIELLEKVEALGEDEEAGAPLPLIRWTEAASKKLDAKVAASPPIAAEFVRGMLKRDAEDLAREQGDAEITDEVLVRLWDSPKEEVAWTDEAWARLERPPDFVRSGIRKAAERRARKMGVAVITSDLLTKFRNEAMMKAVRRIRAFGHKELTFAAFEDALKKTPRLQDNPQAAKRLEEIRAFMEQRGEIGLLPDELMERFRRYLKDGTPLGP